MRLLSRSLSTLNSREGCAVFSYIKKITTSFCSISSLLNDKQKQIVFYAESKSDYIFHGNVLDKLLENNDQKVFYITSSFDDPLLQDTRPNLYVFYIKDGGILSYFFQKIRAEVFVTTLPDLGYFHFKRSPHVKHYCYIFHSLNSAHMVYTKHAFENYDHIFSVGPHLSDEVRAMERMYDWPRKKLVEQGYGRLDQLLERKKAFTDVEDKTVLLAPSWGDNGLIELGVAQTVCEMLLERNYNMILQPHPMTLRKSPHKIAQLKKQFGDDKRFTLNDNIGNTNAFFTSSYLITDWSGIGPEYAFTHKKKICYINTSAPKCRNDEYKDIDMVPMEVSIRERIGIVLNVVDVGRLSDVLLELDEQKADNAELIESIMRDTVYNVGTSDEVGANYILSLLAAK
jgi:hypothetical protein